MRAGKDKVESDSVKGDARDAANSEAAKGQVKLVQGEVGAILVSAN